MKVGFNLGGVERKRTKAKALIKFVGGTLLPFSLPNLSLSLSLSLCWSPPVFALLLSRFHIITCHSPLYSCILWLYYVYVHDFMPYVI